MISKKKKEMAKRVPLNLKGVSDQQYRNFINKSKSSDQILEKMKKDENEIENKTAWGRERFPKK